MAKGPTPSDLTGQVFGRLTALRAGKPLFAERRRSWVCQCSCGKQITIAVKQLRNGMATSCGCSRSEATKARHAATRAGIVGSRFGKLTVVAELPTNGEKTRWQCQCDCGRTTVTTLTNLRRPHGTVSCGCHRKNQRDISRARRVAASDAKGVDGKICACCGQHRMPAMFHRDRTLASGLGAYCRTCRVEKKRFWDYGLTSDQYAALIASQTNSCAICRLPFGETRPARVDHSHRTGKVRGLLCDLCNLGIGSLKENLDTLAAAGNYLRKWRKHGG